MRKYRREIIVGFLTVAATVLAVGYFFGRISERKEAVDTDLYGLIAPSSRGVLAINRPETFARFMLAEKSTHDLFASVLPDIYLLLLKKNPSLSHVVVSFHPQGAVMYAQADARQAYLINKEILTPVFNAYSPQQHMVNGISFTYFPVADRRFFGCYQYQGVWAGSFSKRLLEEAAGRQLAYGNAGQAAGRFCAPETAAPVTLFVPLDSLDLYVSIDDSTQWRLGNRWLTADLYVRGGDLCGIGALPYEAERDSLYVPMADTLARRLESFFPSHRFSAQADPDSVSVYFTVCK